MIHATKAYAATQTKAALSSTSDLRVNTNSVPFWHVWGSISNTSPSKAMMNTYTASHSQTAFENQLRLSSIQAPKRLLMLQRTACPFSLIYNPCRTAVHYVGQAC